MLAKSCLNREEDGKMRVVALKPAKISKEELDSIPASVNLFFKHSQRKGQR
jgi:hypothetical protein